MTNKNILRYSLENWESNKKPIKIISVPGDKKPPLVDSDKEMYCFDDISDSLYYGKTNPASADAIYLEDKKVYLIEFKSGFKKKITIKSLDKEKAKCENLNDVCEDYWNLFFKKQNTETQQLMDSIKFKLIESYITLEKLIMPKCEDSKVNYQLIFVVVIDEDEIDNMEDTLNALCGTHGSSDTNNCFQDIRKSLKRFIGQKDANGNSYYYDEIKVVSIADFKNGLKQL